MSLYNVGIIVLGCYVDPTKYLEETELLVNEYVDAARGGDYPTLRFIGSSSYGMDFTGELGLVSDEGVSDVTQRERIDLTNLSNDEFKGYVDKILSVGHSRYKSKSDFLGLCDPSTSMIFRGPDWEGLDITVVYNQMFKRVKLKEFYDFLIVVDNPPKGMSNTDSIIRSLLELGGEDIYVYTDKPRESLSYLKEFPKVNLESLT